MKKYLILIGSAIAIVSALSSCKKDSAPEPVNTILSIADYTKLNPGNYWIYNTYKIDSNGNETLYLTDSAYVNGEAVIDGNSYTIVHRFWMPNDDYFLRDSSDNLVDTTGRLWLSTTITADTFYTYTDPLGYFDKYYVMNPAPSSFTVPAGTFSDLLDVKSIAYMFAPFDSSYNPIISHTYYAKQVGKIFEEYRLGTDLSTRYERRLASYDVQ